MIAARKPKTREDWHPADIKAALAKKGYTFARIAREFGYQPPGPNRVLRSTWPVMEQIVADIIGLHPSDIWPSRYDETRKPLKVDLKSFSRLRTKQNHSKGGRG